MKDSYLDCRNSDNCLKLLFSTYGKIPVDGVPYQPPVRYSSYRIMLHAEQARRLCCMAKLEHNYFPGGTAPVALLFILWNATSIQ